MKRRLTKFTSGLLSAVMVLTMIAGILPTMAVPTEAADAIDAGQAPFVYSGLYNLFLLPEAVLCAVVAATPAFRRVYAVMQRSAK